jgi:hypothetical protein
VSRHRLPRAAGRLECVLGFVSMVDWFFLLAIWIGAERAWSGSLPAVLVLASRLPTFLGGTLGGWAVDRWGARTMTLVDFGVASGTGQHRHPPEPWTVQHNRARVTMAEHAFGGFPKPVLVWHVEFAYLLARGRTSITLISVAP